MRGRVHPLRDALADPRVVFPGYVFGRGYWELQRHARMCCAPTQVGARIP